MIKLEFKVYCCSNETVEVCIRNSKEISIVWTRKTPDYTSCGVSEPHVDDAIIRIIDNIFPRISHKFDNNMHVYTYKTNTPLRIKAKHFVCSNIDDPCIIAKKIINAYTLISKWLILYNGIKIDTFKVSYN